MYVAIENMDAQPLYVISRAAGTSYGKGDFKESRVWNCLQKEHMSVFEHAHVSFRIDGISRACTHQLVRHRMASFVQESQRYCQIDVADEWYVKPKSLKGVSAVAFYGVMDCCAEAYIKALNDGIKPEDARFMLPEATKTMIVMTMNWRELLHFLDLRLDKHAQWEIRELAANMVEALAEASTEAAEILRHAGFLTEY